MTDGELRQLVTGKLKHIRDGNWYDLLGLDKGCSDNEIRSAHRELVGLLHPDRLGRRDLGDLARPAKELFQSLDKAFQTLANPAARDHYDRVRFGRLPSTPKLQPAPTTEGPPVSDDPDVERWSQKAREMLAAGRPGDAERYLRMAYDRDGSDGKVAQQLGALLLQDQARPIEERLAEARPVLERAAKLAPYSAVSRYALAQYWRAVGDDEHYRSELEATLRCDSNHRAKDELAQIRLNERREQPAAAKVRPSGLLSRLFKRE